MNGMNRPFLIGIMILVCHGNTANVYPPAVSAATWSLESNVKDIRTGERYGGGTRIRSPLAGVSFLVPKDWRALLPGGTVLFLDSAVNPGLGIIQLLTDVSKQSLIEQLSEPQSIEPGFLLHPVGSIQDEGSTLTGLFAGGQDMAFAMARIGPSSSAVIYLIIGRKTEEALLSRLMKELVSSTEFLDPDDASTIRMYYERFTGMVLTPKLDDKISPSVTLSALHLCDDGHFIRSTQLRSVQGRPDDAGDGSVYHESGTWLIDVREGKVQIVLTKATGGSEQWGVFEEDGNLILDKWPFSVEISKSCL